jgi:CHAT domain
VILKLSAAGFVDAARWQWLLSNDDSGQVAARHEVRLDPASWQFSAFSDLMGYLSWHTAPDRLRQDEARIVAELGEWIGSAVLGPIAASLAQAAPVTVRVTVPEGAEELLARPLELAHASGRPLAAQGVTLVMQPEQVGGNASGPVGSRLRVLGLFSMPEGGQALSLRQERQSLLELMRELGAVGKAAEVRVLQYGVTRSRLREVLSDGEGWDIVHISGHGSPGRLLLETQDGKPDLVDGAQLAQLLSLARGRLKLLTLSACWSAAAAVADQRQLLGLPVPAGTDPQPGSQPRPSGSLAAELASQSGCAVLAMRYPVDDEFAARLSRRLYALLAAAGHSLPRALGITLGELRSQAGDAFRALSLVTPTLFGEQAAKLRLAAPERAPGGAGADAPQPEGVPREAARFVGRTGMMARASAALAPQSGLAGFCCMECQAAARPPVRWSWLTGTNMPSTRSPGSRHLTAERTLTAR